MASEKLYRNTLIQQGLPVDAWYQSIKRLNNFRPLFWTNWCFIFATKGQVKPLSWWLCEFLYLLC